MALGSVGIALILYKGGFDVFNGKLSYGDLVIFISYSTLFYDPIRTLANLLTRFQDAQASAERVISLINTDSDIIDRPDVIKNMGKLEI